MCMNYHTMVPSKMSKVFKIIIHGERPDSKLVWEQTILPLIKSHDTIEVKFLLPPHLIFYHANYAKFTKGYKLGSNIRVQYYYIAVPNRYFTKSIILFNLSMFWSRLAFYLFVWDSKAEYYCRGYLSGVLLSNFSACFTFDPRSDYISEQLTLQRINLNSSIHKFLLSIEEKTLKSASKVFAVNENHRLMLLKRGARKSTTECKYFSISRWKFLPPRNPDFTQSINLCFIGTLDFNYWNDVTVYTQYLQKISSNDNVKITVYSSNLRKCVKQELEKIEKANIIFDEYDLESFRNKLSQQHFGIMFMRELPDAETRFGVKAAEYLSASLPIICNSNVGALSEFIRVHKCGLVCDNPDDLSFCIMRLIQRYDYYSQNAFKISKQFFDNGT